jgi:rare lipoprotein A
MQAAASWYGPGFIGHRTACGQTLTDGLIGVAHKTLPCGTLITFRSGDRIVTAPVVDRGPYVAGRTFDLTAALCRALAHCWTGPLDYQLAD